MKNNNTYQPYSAKEILEAKHSFKSTIQETSNALAQLDIQDLRCDIAIDNVDRFTQKVSSSSLSLLNTKIKQENGKTLLHLAVEKANYEMVEALLNKGIDIYTTNNDGYTALELATEPAIIELLEGYETTGGKTTKEATHEKSALAFNTKIEQQESGSKAELAEDDLIATLDQPQAVSFAGQDFSEQDLDI